MRPQRKVAGLLVPVVLSVECYALAEHGVGPHWAVVPEHTRYHVPGEAQGEFVPSVVCAPASGTNSTETWTVFSNGLTPSWFPAASSQEILHPPPIIILPQPQKREATRMVAQHSFPRPMLNREIPTLIWRKDLAFAYRAPLKRFVFRRP